MVGYVNLQNLEVSAVNLDDMRCAVEVDNKWRLIPLARKPTATPASRNSETINFSLTDIAVAGEQTLGNLQLVFGLQAGTDWDDHLRAAAAASQSINLDFRILGGELFANTTGTTVQVKAKETGGQEVGLSEVLFAAAGQAAVPQIGRHVKRGAVIEMTDAAKAIDLTVISHIYYASVNSEGVGQSPKYYAKGVVNDSAAEAGFSIREQSIQWSYSGEMLSYNDQFDERLGLCAIEISQEGAVAERKLIRHADVDAASTFYSPSL